MKKQTILITGGAQRIGKAIALSLKNNNLNFVIHYNSSIKEAKDLKNSLIKSGNQCEIIKCDLNKPGQVSKIILKSKRIFGSVDFLVNNASLFLNDNIETLSDGLWYDHMLSLIHI